MEPPKHEWSRQKSKRLMVRLSACFFGGLAAMLFLGGLVLLINGRLGGLFFWGYAFFLALGVLGAASRCPPARWIVVRNGIFIRNAKDRHRFVPWSSIKFIDAKTCHNGFHRMILETDSGQEIMQTRSIELLPFLNKLLDSLPVNLERKSLLKLRRKLRKDILRANLFPLSMPFFLFCFLLCFPIYILAAFGLSVEETGFELWCLILGSTIILLSGLLFWLRLWHNGRLSRITDEILDELESRNFSAEIAAARSPKHHFGEPPRTVSKRVRRVAFFSGDGGGTLSLFPLFMAPIFYALLIGIFISVNELEIRYAFLPFRWVPAGQGKIVRIEDSSTKTAPSGAPAETGRDVITFEKTLKNEKPFTCENVSWASHGIFRVGQEVPLLQYAGEETCLQIDDPYFKNEVLTGLGLLFVFCAILFLAFAILWFDAKLKSKRLLRLLQTAKVERFRVRFRKQGVYSILSPLGEFSEPISVKRIGAFPGETVNVFLDEAKPKRSFVAESFPSRLTYDATNGELDCDSDRRYRIGVAGLVLFGSGFILIFARILLVW